MNKLCLNVMILASIIVSIICCYKSTDKYILLFLLPAVFALVSITFVNPLIEKGISSITFYLILITAFLRYVFLPLTIAIDPNYNVANYICNDTFQLSNAIIFMCYELIIIFIFLYFYCTGSNKTILFKYMHQEQALKISKQNVALLIGIIALSTSLLSPTALNSIHFFKLDVGIDSRVGEDLLTTKDLIYRQMFIISTLVIFVVLTCLCCEKYIIRNSKVYVYIPLILAITCIGIIIGEQRSGQVYTSFAAILFLRKLYPKYKAQITRILIIIATLVLILLSIYKMFFAFNQSSYIEALSKAGDSYYTLSYSSEIYLLGPVSVAASLSMFFNYNTMMGFETLIFDFIRSTMGLHFFVKDIPIESSSVIFNKFVTNGLTSGYLLPISCNGMLYLGPILGPIIIILFYRLSFYIEIIMKTTKQPLVYFFSAYILVRYSTCMISSNINTVLTMSSMVLIFVFPIYLLNKLSK